MREFVEKPSPDEVGTNLINAGAYILERDVLDGMAPSGTRISIEREVFPTLVGNGLYGYEASGYWMDIGTPERYLQATFEILEGDVRTEVGRAVAEAGGVLRHGGNGAGIVHGPALVGSELRARRDRPRRRPHRAGPRREGRRRRAHRQLGDARRGHGRRRHADHRVDRRGPASPSASTAASRAGWCSARA